MFMETTCWLSKTPQNIRQKKKCIAIAYYAIHKSVAIRESLTGHIRSEDNPADLLTKVVTSYERKHFVSLVLYDIYVGDN